MRIYLLLVAMLVGCAADDVVDPRESQPRVEQACMAAFDATLQAYEASQGDVPEECNDLPSSFTIHYVDTFPKGCRLDKDAPPDHVLWGCTYAERGDIYIKRGLSETDTIDIAAHEWVHAIDYCVTGFKDFEHDREGLWGNDPSSVEFQGAITSQLGSCI